VRGKANPLFPSACFLGRFSGDEQGNSPPVPSSLALPCEIKHPNSEFGSDYPHVSLILHPHLPAMFPASSIYHDSCYCYYYFFKKFLFTLAVHLCANSSMNPERQATFSELIRCLR
jgi:hypothetical protein